MEATALIENLWDGYAGWLLFLAALGFWWLFAVWDGKNEPAGLKPYTTAGAVLAFVIGLPLAGQVFMTLWQVPMLWPESVTVLPREGKSVFDSWANFLNSLAWLAARAGLLFVFLTAVLAPSLLIWWTVERMGRFFLTMTGAIGKERALALQQQTHEAEAQAAVMKIYNEHAHDEDGEARIVILTMAQLKQYGITGEAATKLRESLQDWNTRAADKRAGFKEWIDTYGQHLRPDEWEAAIKMMGEAIGKGRGDRVKSEDFSKWKFQVEQPGGH